MSTFLLALWFSLIGADRIDLVGGSGPFILTPFLALTPIVALSELIRRHRQHRPVLLPVGGIIYLLTTGALLVAIFGSVLVARETGVSESRAMLLLGQLAGAFTVALLASDREDLVHVLASGAVASLFLFVLFDALEVKWALGRSADLYRFGLVTASVGDLQRAGPIPRLGGPVADANRGAFVLLFYALTLPSIRRAWVRRGAMVLVALVFVAALSRSGTLAAVGAGAMLVLERRVRIPAAALVAGALVVSAALLLVITRPDIIDRGLALLNTPAASRLSVNEGSAQSHVALIGRGLTQATSSIPSATVGLGWGNSYLVLQDMFPGSKYGNYHSLYVTMFAEAGIAALVLFLWLIGVPLVASNPWRPLIAGAVMFNFFYQTGTEAAFWFGLALAWMSIKRFSVRVASPVPSFPTTP